MSAGFTIAISLLGNAAQSLAHKVSAASSQETSSFVLEIADDLVVNDIISFLQNSVNQASLHGVPNRIEVLTKMVRQKSPLQHHSRATLSSTSSSGESWVQILLLVFIALLFVLFAAYLVMNLTKNQDNALHEEKVGKTRDIGVAFNSFAEASEEVVCDKPVGTASRMTNLPPTAGPRTKGLSTSPASTHVSSTSFSMTPPHSVGSGSKKDKVSSMPTLVEDTLTLIDSHTTDEGKRSFPPPLSLSPRPYHPVSIASTDSVSSSWYFPHAAFQELQNGGIVEVNDCDGSPAFYARLVFKNDFCHLEISRTSSWQTPHATIGPFSWPESSSSEATIVGPAGDEYGSFAKRGQSFRVSHKSQGDNDVLTLDPVMTREGCPVLEVSAGDGMPVGSARLNEEDEDVEIDADPDVDGALIVSCVLASFVSNPGLFDTPSKKCNPQSDS